MANSGPHSGAPHGWGTEDVSVRAREGWWASSDTPFWLVTVAALVAAAAFVVWGCVYSAVAGAYVAAGCLFVIPVLLDIILRHHLARIAGGSVLLCISIATLFFGSGFAPAAILMIIAGAGTAMTRGWSRGVLAVIAVALSTAAVLASLAFAHHALTRPIAGFKVEIAKTQAGENAVRGLARNPQPLGPEVTSTSTSSTSATEVLYVEIASAASPTQREQIKLELLSLPDVVSIETYR